MQNTDSSFRQLVVTLRRSIVADRRLTLGMVTMRGVSVSAARRRASSRVSKLAAVRAMPRAITYCVARTKAQYGHDKIDAVS